MEARALAAEAATVPEHVLLSPQSPEAPASAKWKEDDRIEALCRKDDMTRYYPGTVHEVNVDGTYAVVFDGEKYRDDSPPYLYDADVLEDHIRELTDAPATPAPAAPVTAAALPPPGTRVAVRFMDGNANDEGGAFECKSMRRPMFAPGQDELLNRAPESAPSQQSKRPQAGAPEERAAQRQRFER